MKFLAAGLLVLLAFLQYRLWLGEGGMREVVRLRGEISAQLEENAQFRERNRTLAAEVQDLKKGTTAIEERARTDLGMIRQGETFYQVVEPRQAAGGPAVSQDEAMPGGAREPATPSQSSPASSADGHPAAPSPRPDEFEGAGRTAGDVRRAAAAAAR